MRRPRPIRGLLAGLLALVTFTSSAVAMTAGGRSSGLGALARSVTAQVADAAHFATSAGGHLDGTHAGRRGEDGGAAHDGHHR